MCGGAAATTSTLARIENILLKPLLLLKYEFSRRLVLTVRIPGVATPAGSSSRRPLWQAARHCCCRSRRPRWGEWDVRRAGHRGLKGLFRFSDLTRFDSGDNEERCGKFVKTGIFPKRNENTIYNLESELVTRVFILNSMILGLSTLLPLLLRCHCCQKARVLESPLGSDSEPVVRG